MEDIAAAIVREVQEGIDGSDVRAGIIGEIGCSHPLKASEIKVGGDKREREREREREKRREKKERKGEKERKR